MKKFFKSLRSKIILFVLLAGIIPAALLHLIVVNTYERTLINRRMAEVQQQFTLLTAKLSAAENVKDALVPEVSQDLLVYSDAYEGRLLVVDDQFRIILDSVNADTGRYCISDPVFTAYSGKSWQNYSKNTSFIEFALPLVYTGGEEKTVTGVLVFSSTTEWIRESIDDVQSGMIILESALLVLLLLFALYISHVLVLPIQHIAYRMEEVEEGDPSVDFSQFNSYSEINEILDSTSHIIRRYRALEKNQEEFVSNVSHELKTPMASIRVLADSLIGQQNIDEETYQDFLSDISVEIDRESHIIEDLLSMTRLENASESLNLQTVDINEMLLDLLKSIRPIASERKIEVIYESFRRVAADVDENKLRQAFSNLVENAVKYNTDGGIVKVSLDADHEYFYVKVSDSGIGIPEDAIEHIFDRFYRVDKARSRDTGGTGLGLSITKSVVLMHYGIIRVESMPGEGTTFTVRIPLKHVRKEGA